MVLIFLTNCTYNVATVANCMTTLHHNCHDAIVDAEMLL